MEVESSTKQQYFSALRRMVEEQERAATKTLAEQRQAAVEASAYHRRAAADPIHDLRVRVPAADRPHKCGPPSVVEIGVRGFEVHDFNASSYLDRATSIRCSRECFNGSTGLFLSTASPAAATTATSSTATVSFPGDSTSTATSAAAYKLFDRMPRYSEWSSDCTLSIMVCRALYPVNEDLLHPILAPYGVKRLVVNPRVTTAMGSQCVTAIAEMNSKDAAARAQIALHGQCLFDGCCYLRVKLAAPYELVLAAATSTATSPLKILQAMTMSTSATSSVLVAASTCAPAVVLLGSIPDNAPAATATGETTLTSVTPSCCIEAVGLTTPSPTMNSPGDPSRDTTESRSAPAPAATVLPATAATDGNLNRQAISGVASTPATCSTECSGSRVGAPPNVCPSTHATASGLLPVQVWMSPSTFPAISACGNSLDAADVSAEEVFLDSKDMYPTTPRSSEVSTFQLLKLFPNCKFSAFVQCPSPVGMCVSLPMEFLEHDNQSQCKEVNKLVNSSAAAHQATGWAETQVVSQVWTIFQSTSHATIFLLPWDPGALMYGIRTKFQAKLEQKWMLWSSGDILLLVPIVMRTTSDKFHGTLMVERLIREGALSFQYFGKLHEKQAKAESQSESFPWYVAWLLVVFPCDCPEFSGSGNLTTMKLMFGSEFATCCLKGKSFRESIMPCGGNTMLNSGNRFDQPLLPIVSSEAYFEKRSTVLPPFSPRKMQISMNCCQGKFAWDPGRWVLTKSSAGIVHKFRLQMGEMPQLHIKTSTKIGVDRDYSISYTCYFNNLSADDIYYYDAFLNCISCYLNLFNLVQVTLGNGYLGDNNSDQERQVQWDPGGFAWRRLGVKPKPKEGGIVSDLFHATPGLDGGLQLTGLGLPRSYHRKPLQIPKGMDTHDSAWNRKASAWTPVSCFLSLSVATASSSSSISKFSDL